MNMQNVAVVVDMWEQVLTGVVSLPPGIRLSDFLNGDSIGQSDGSGTFLELSDVTISRADGTKESAETIYINREAIQMVRTLENDSARGIGAKDGPKQYPFVHKSPVRATMRMPGYEINGYLHCTNVQEIPQLLTQELAFLPCTDAKIRGVNGEYSWNAGFVAINRRQVYSFKHDKCLYS